MAYGGSYRSKMSDETFDFLCTTCAEDNKTLEAVKYCVECCNYCCQSCVDAHKKFPTLRNHSLMEVDQGQQAGGQQSRYLEVPIERCRIHKTQLVNMYCEYHDDVGCATCFVTDHKSCAKSHIHSIPDTIDAIFKLKDCEQTYGQLKDAVVSMETVSKDEVARLQNLVKARNDVLGELNSTEKTLIAMVRKATELSRNQVETTYKQLEKEILGKKQSAENITKDLKTSKDKIDRSAGNRAQRLVTSKHANTQIEAAASEMTKHLITQPNTDVELSFIPDQRLMEYMNSLDRIGQVQRYEIQKKTNLDRHTQGKQTHGLYKVKSGRDISIKIRDHSSSYILSYCCLTHDDQLLVTDYNNRKLKRFNTKNMSLVDYCTVDTRPYDVCCISETEVALACSEKKIQFFAIDGKMRPTRKIEVGHYCYGIAFNGDKLYVTGEGDRLYVHDLNGKCLKTITQDNDGNKVLSLSRVVSFNKKGDRLFVGDRDKGLICFDGKGHYLSTITDTDLKYIMGACVDGRGNLFVVGWGSHNVVQFNDTGKKVGVIVNENDGLKDPLGVCFDRNLNRLYVTMWKSDVVKMYEIE